MRWMALLALCTPLVAFGQSRGEYDPIPLINPPWPHAPQQPHNPKRPAPPLLLQPLDTDRPLAPPPPPPLPDLAAAATHAAGRVTLPVAPDWRTPKVGVQAPDRLEDDGDRVADMVMARWHRDAVDRGLNDPYFSLARKELEKRWNPEPKVEEKGLAGYFALLQQGLEEKSRILDKMTELQSTRLAGTAPVVTGEPDTDRDIQAMDDAAVLRDAHLYNRLALISVTADSLGKLTGVSLLMPSHNPAMDNEILREFREGDLILPPPPPEGRGISDHMTMVWAFRLTVIIAPPLPVVGGTFEEAALFDKSLGPAIDVMLPLERRIYKHVELVEVH